MSRWAERLKAKYANAEIAEIAKKAPESLLEGSFGNSGKFGIGISAETDPAEWRGEVEELQEPRRGAPDWHAPKPLPAGSLVARLCEAGATVRTWSNGHGAMASIEAPAGIPLELVREVEARGWRIIPGIKPNPEGEHDSWAFGGVPARDLDQ